jgi:flagellar biosynthesis/type III secretory pathway M-ring protein FliF/YscJ
MSDVIINAALVVVVLLMVAIFVQVYLVARDRRITMKARRAAAEQTIATQKEISDRLASGTLKIQFDAKDAADVIVKAIKKRNRQRGARSAGI